MHLFIENDILNNCSKINNRKHTGYIVVAVHNMTYQDVSVLLSGSFSFAVSTGIYAKVHSDIDSYLEICSIQGGMAVSILKSASQVSSLPKK